MRFFLWKHARRDRKSQLTPWFASHGTVNSTQHSELSSASVVEGAKIELDFGSVQGYFTSN